MTVCIHRYYVIIQACVATNIKSNIIYISYQCDLLSMDIAGKWNLLIWQNQNSITIYSGNSTDAILIESTSDALIKIKRCSSNENNVRPAWEKKTHIITDCYQLHITEQTYLKKIF